MAQKTPLPLRRCGWRKTENIREGGEKHGSMKNLWEDKKNAKSWRKKGKTENVDLTFDTFFIFTPLKNSDLAVRLGGEREETDWFGGREMMCSHLSRLMGNPIENIVLLCTDFL